MTRQLQHPNYCTTPLGYEGVSAQSDGWSTGPCTYHPYEEDLARLGATAYDNAPGWCGIRYSALNIQRIVAVNGLGSSMCAQCLEFRNAAGGPSMFVLAVDQKGAPGLDVSHTSFQNAFPGANALDPQTCSWRITSQSYCSGTCFGSPEECTPGQRNLLPAYLLPPVGSSGKPHPTPTPNSEPEPTPKPEPEPAPKPEPESSPDSTTRKPTHSQIPQQPAELPSSQSVVSSSLTHASDQTTVQSPVLTQTLKQSSSSMSASASTQHMPLSTSQLGTNGETAPMPHTGAGLVSSSLSILGDINAHLALAVLTTAIISLVTDVL
ncbi:hypothetical protein BDEG_21947 [Batrachochytrium dendrobatidis JEL423]|uniref:Uncharacterized protein n=1 Tax=Batrachochytrium dendrobatidis (strain JEL423) TaxID=403673 RepID=A0A177WD07_BATDL|nr:hypothetical protein BDEG_21947 [Batrachochytrium dendrobatidis JEL423]